ncbi:hypothetical protein P261_00469 [Lachnospiraceae bacterium TWA4]|nr:hypothetical protein P261_00469 [Lachnospiraceae bacterium TWA4]
MNSDEKQKKHLKKELKILTEIVDVLSKDINQINRVCKITNILLENFKQEYVESKLDEKEKRLIVEVAILYSMGKDTNEKVINSTWMQLVKMAVEFEKLTEIVNFEEAVYQISEGEYSSELMRIFRLSIIQLLDVSK